MIRGKHHIFSQVAPLLISLFSELCNALSTRKNASQVLQSNHESPAWSMRIVDECLWWHFWRVFYDVGLLLYARRGHTCNDTHCRSYARKALTPSLMVCLSLNQAIGTYLANCINCQAIVLENCSTSLQVCNEKNIFWFWVSVFCEWCHKWDSFRPLWPTSSGPRPKLLNGSSSLTFLLETRLKSESFETLDDLLGFQFKSDDLKTTK